MAKFLAEQSGFYLLWTLMTLITWAGPELWPPPPWPNWNGWNTLNKITPFQDISLDPMEYLRSIIIHASKSFDHLNTK